MKTTHKYGRICPEKTFNDLCDAERNQLLIVQVDSVEGARFYEIVTIKDFAEAIKQGATTQPEADNSADFIEACETELKSDPFKSGWHNGHKLIDIRENDPEWWARALKELKNNFIVSKMRTIEEGIANGKIYS